VEAVDLHVGDVKNEDAVLLISHLDRRAAGPRGQCRSTHRPAGDSQFMLAEFSDAAVAIFSALARQRTAISNSTSRKS
jgi:hypothetical protein